MRVAAPTSIEPRRPELSVHRPAGISITAWAAAAQRNPIPTSPTPCSRPSVTNSGTREIRRPNTMKPLDRLTIRAAR